MITLPAVLEDVFGNLILGEAGAQMLWTSVGAQVINLLVMLLETNADGKMKVMEVIASLLVFQN